MNPVRPVRSIRPGILSLLRTLSFILAALLLAAVANATGINLSWDDCGEYGKDVQEFACDTNTGPPFVLYASFIPPEGIDHFVGLSASVRLAATSYPDWWKVGSCRPASALTVAFDGGGNCLDPWGGSTGGGSLFTIGGYGSNTGRLLVQAANPEALALGSVEYTAFRIRVARSLSTGGTCAGCSQPLAFTLNEIQLFQPIQYANDPVLTTPITRNRAWWQGVVGVGPTISSFSPAGGPSGTLVTVHGSDLSGASIVRFGGVPAIASPVSSTEARAFVPLGVSSGPLTVETPFGSASSAASFIAAPTIDQAVPPSAPVGTPVWLRGRGFTGVTQVSFGGVPAAFDVASDDQLFTEVPSGASMGLIEVSNSGGSDTHGPFWVGPARGGINLSWNECANRGQDLVSWECPNETAYFPLIGSFVPPPGVTRAIWLDGDIAISATHLPDWWRHGAGECRGVGGISADSRFGSEPTCSVPEYWSGGVGFQYQIGFYGANTARLKVSQVFGSGGVALHPYNEYYAFRVLFGRQRYSESCSGCGDPVRLELRNIQLHQAAELNNDPVLTDPIFRTVAYWQGTPGSATVLSGFTPAGGPIGTLVTLSGSGFTGTRNVRFGPAEAPFNVVSDSEVHALVPQTYTAPIAVVTPQGTGFSPAAFFLPPEVLQVVPPVGMEGDEITINGANLSGTTAVTFNGLAASFSVRSDRELTAIVPEGAKTGPLAVTNPAGTTVFAENFEVVNESTPTLVSLARSEVLSDRVRLAWDIPRGGAAVLYRREGLGAWNEQARLSANATGRLEFEDTDVRAGTTYGYRLGLLIGRREIFGGDVTIAMPAGVSGVLELGGLEWSKGRLRASLNLPASGSATLEVFDLSGRRTLERTVESSEPGLRTAEWEAPGLASGIYFARLTQNRSHASRRFFVAQ